MPYNQKYPFVETLPAVADVLAKVRILHSLKSKEELVYMMYVKGMTEAEARMIIESKSKS